MQPDVYVFYSTTNIINFLLQLVRYSWNEVKVCLNSHFNPSNVSIQFNYQSSISLRYTLIDLF